MKINVVEDCGNAPKKLILRDLNIAFTQCNIAQALEFVADDIQWETKGSNNIVRNKQELAAKLEAASTHPINQLTINRIITHGRDSAVEGSFTLEDETVFAYCNFYQFNGLAKSARVKSITSYVIKTSD